MGDERNDTSLKSNEEGGQSCDTGEDEQAGDIKDDQSLEASRDKAHVAGGSSRSIGTRRFDETVGPA